MTITMHHHVHYHHHRHTLSPPTSYIMIIIIVIIIIIIIIIWALLPIWVASQSLNSNSKPPHQSQLNPLSMALTMVVTVLTLQEPYQVC
jgi:heme/copper-type cytochrome/quinol oxidase subunit 2